MHSEHCITHIMIGHGTLTSLYTISLILLLKCEHDPRIYDLHRNKRNVPYAITNPVACQHEACPTVSVANMKHYESRHLLLLLCDTSHAICYLLHCDTSHAICHQLHCDSNHIYLLHCDTSHAICYQLHCDSSHIYLLHCDTSHAICYLLRCDMSHAICCCIVTRITISAVTL